MLGPGEAKLPAQERLLQAPPALAWLALPAYLSEPEGNSGAAWAVSPERPAGPAGRALGVEAHDLKTSPGPATPAYKLGKSPSCANRPLAGQFC